MEYIQIQWEHIPVSVMLSTFSREGSDEFHAILEWSGPLSGAGEQFGTMEAAIQQLLQMPVLEHAVLVWKRFFVSDAVNQKDYITASFDEAVSVVQQPPLNGTKVSLLLYLVRNARIEKNAVHGVSMVRPQVRHLFHTRMHDTHGGIEKQTGKVFSDYINDLGRNNCTLEANCIRTWIFVQDVDVQYAGMVISRKNYFDSQGLTSDTHYIASTGIEGRYIRPEVLMLMDAYAIEGIKKDQIKYLHAPSHLNPTSEYGVTFERGTAVEYGDRRHIFISGTASINNKGEIVHPLDIEKQIERTLENIRALLSEADAGMDDVAHMIVYLRDTGDYILVNNYFHSHFADIPKVIVLAPVCRPGWLIEIECIAITRTDHAQWPIF